MSNEVGIRGKLKKNNRTWLLTARRRRSPENEAPVAGKMAPESSAETEGKESWENAKEMLEMEE